MSNSEVSNSDPNETMGVIWEKCFSKEICIKIPFDGKKCVGASACVRILRSGGSYFLELQVFGARKKIQLLGDACLDLNAGVASAKVCAAPKFNNGNLKGVRIKLMLCIEALGLRQCWTLYNGDINFLVVSEIRGSSATVEADADAAGAEFIYQEDDPVDEGVTCDVFDAFQGV